MGLLQRTAMYFMLIKAAAEIKQKAESIGLDKVKGMVENGESIVEMYLGESSEVKKAKRRQDANLLIQAGITPEMLWDEVVKQLPELGTMIQGKDGYVQSEIKRIETFVRGGG